jgi:hypothetical protein
MGLHITLKIALHTSHHTTHHITLHITLHITIHITLQIAHRVTQQYTGRKRAEPSRFTEEKKIFQNLEEKMFPILDDALNTFVIGLGMLP